MPKSQEEMDKIFDYHAPKEDQPTRYEAIRHAAKDFAKIIDELCPDSEEKSVVFMHFQTAVMWCNAAIARNE
jgi:hypothetical protein